METVNTNLSSLMLQLTQVSSKNTEMVGRNLGKSGYSIGKDIAFSCAEGVTDKFSSFDKLVNNFATFKDVIATANDGISQMKSQGESIRYLVERAQQEGVTPELLDSLQEEVNARIEAIQKIKENSVYNDVNPFKTAFSLDIPDWQSYIKVPDTEDKNDEEGSQMSEVLASISFDMSINGDGENSFNIGASATIEIGLNEDGSLQINVDATMDFDLSGLREQGIASNGALDMINNFINMLTGKQNDLNTASNIIDGIFASATANIEGNGFAISASNDINFEGESSKSLKGQIVQHASITLDSTANQCPSIAINLL